MECYRFMGAGHAQCPTFFSGSRRLGSSMKTGAVTINAADRTHRSDANHPDPKRLGEVALRFSVTCQSVLIIASETRLARH